MDLRIEHRLKQSLKFSTALQNAVEVLQLTQLELAQRIREEIEKNPLLEERPPPSPSYFARELPSEIRQSPSTYELILEQIRESNFSFEEAKAAEILYHFLDDKGFLPLPLEKIAEEMALPLPLLERILPALQTFDPPGIFAKNLQESLLIQLRSMGEKETSSYFLIKNCFDDLLKGKFKAIEKKMGAFSLPEAVKKLARLSLRPLKSRQKDNPLFLKPDISVCKAEDKWLIEVLDEDLPQIVFRSDYLDIPSVSSEEKAAIRGWHTSAKWLFRTLRRRRQILLEIGILLIKKQEDYLEGKGDLTPLSIGQAAQLLDLHESTLSRALYGKCLLSPRGLLPLRSFFSASLQETFDVKKTLALLVAQEESPLSDEALQKALQERGFSIARRTVAKYRKELKIAAKAQRKLFLP